jgi:hypothetical protein
MFLGDRNRLCFHLQIPQKSPDPCDKDETPGLFPLFRLDLLSDQTNDPVLIRLSSIIEM